MNSFVCVYVEREREREREREKFIDAFMLLFYLESL